MFTDVDDNGVYPDLRRIKEQGHFCHLWRFVTEKLRVSPFMFRRQLTYLGVLALQYPVVNVLYGLKHCPTVKKKPRAAVFSPMGSSKR